MNKMFIIPIFIALTGFVVFIYGATRILEKYGFTDVEISEHAIFGCSQDDGLRSK